MKDFGRLFKSRPCVGCESKEAIIKAQAAEIQYLQKFVDRLLIDRGLPAIKDKKLKLDNGDPEKLPEWFGKEAYGVS